MSKTIISIENILTLSPMGCIKDKPLGVLQDPNSIFQLTQNTIRHQLS